MLRNLPDIWNYRVFVIDNHPVTIGKLAIALMILIIGIVLAKIFFRVVGKRLLAKSPLKQNTASAILKMFTYFAYLLVLLFALRMVNIPLAAFAFLGGAIAIGLGFGAQNIINNFISGFIIMTERPISTGDLIEVEGILGQVEEIGARCTLVRTGENIHILVPNSAFLEKKIINWTLSDQKIRTKITVFRLRLACKESRRAAVEGCRAKGPGSARPKALCRLFRFWRQCADFRGLLLD